MKAKIKNRLSGIELLKAIAIFLIVLAHMTGTISGSGVDLSHNDYVLNIMNSTNDIQIFILSLFFGLGLLGNDIFFVCSAWFFLDKEDSNKKKLFEMIVEIWIISIIILIISCIYLGSKLELKMIIRNIFPTIFSNNWYITCYVLFCLIYPYLNKIINSLDKKTLFRFCLVTGFCYIFVNFIDADNYFEFSRLILWISIYFIIAYLKIYHIDICNNIKLNIIVLLASIASSILLSLITNILGLNIIFFSNKLLRWYNHSNPIFILIAISSLNIFKNLKIKNNTINYISSLSMFVYVIHENLIIRTYYRPMFVDYAYHLLGFSKVILLDILLSLIWFIASLLLSIIFDKTIRKFLVNILDNLYIKIKSLYINIENKIPRCD